MLNQPSTCLEFPLNRSILFYLLCCGYVYTSLIVPWNTDRNLIQSFPPIPGTILLDSKLVSFLGFSGPSNFMWVYVHVLRSSFNATCCLCDKHLLHVIICQALCRMHKKHLCVYWFRIPLVVGEKNAVQMDLIKKKCNWKVGLGRASGRAGSGA